MSGYGGGATEVASFCNCFTRVERCYTCPSAGEKEGRAQVVREYSIILRWQTPVNGKKANRFLAFAGSTTPGTLISTRFFCEYASSHSKLRKMGRKDYLAVLETEISTNRIFKMQEVKVLETISLSHEKGKAGNGDAALNTTEKMFS